MIKTPITRVGVVVGFLMASVTTTAHHGTAAFEVDKEKAITLTGTVTEWIWSNPHCLLRFDVKEKDGQVVPWVGETQNPQNMTRAGWARTSFRPGDQVTLTLMPVKNGRRLGRIVQVTFPDGRTLR